MSILDIFRPLKKSTVQKWQELGTYQSSFSIFGDDPFKSSVVRSCIRPLADLSAKAEGKCEDIQIEKILRKPNMYMSGHGMLLKVRTKLELLNTAFIYIQRDDKGKLEGLYPVPYSYFEALEYNNGLFIKFYFSGDATRTLILPWDDLAVVRKDYNNSDIAGDDNSSIIRTLQMMTTVDEGLSNSIKATANLRGILKSTKAMLAPEAIKAQKDQFVKDYMTLENSGGIASLDATQEFTPITMNPSTATAEQRKDIREDIYRYFGVNDSIIMGKIETEEFENFYKMRIAPFLHQLSEELTNKVFSGKSLAYAKNKIVFLADQGQFMTMAQKLDFFNKVVLYGGATINEFRQLMMMPPIEGGDTPIRRLDADFINTDEQPRVGNESSKEDDKDEDE